MGPGHEMVQILHRVGRQLIGIGQRQIVVDNPAWLAVAEMLVRKL